MSGGRFAAAQLALIAVLLCGAAALVRAQDNPENAAEPDQALAERLAEQALADETKPAQPAAAAEGEKLPTAAPTQGIDVLELTLKGGILMIPIACMSLLVVAMGIERGLALRRSKLMPAELIDGLGKLAASPSGFDPRKAYRLCQNHPSTAATITKAMLLKVGRPHSEVEHTVADASEREAARLYRNVRTLNLAAAVTPLMGLLGTVFGMIEAFFVTANLPTGVNRAEMLADGIYVALVTTAAGLLVAIPAAMLAHFFEGRIQSLLLDIDEMQMTLLPQVERYEGKLRVSRTQLGDEDKPAEPPRQAAAAT